MTTIYDYSFHGLELELLLQINKQLQILHNCFPDSVITVATVTKTADNDYSYSIKVNRGVWEPLQFSNF